MDKRIIILGFGFVGKFMKRTFQNADFFDIEEGLVLHNGNIIKNDNIREYLNALNENWDLGIICVPTPSLKDGGCDTSQVEKSVEFWKDKVSNFLIKSTIEVGFTEKLIKKYNKPIVFSPEYIGETTNHPMLNLDSKKKFIIFGGTKENIDRVFEIYKYYINAEVKIYRVESNVAELCKYMENSFFAMKVIFCNEFFEIAKAFNINYEDLRDVWLADYRIGRSHTLVYNEKRGFSGKCLPKDMKAIIKSSESVNYSPEILKSILKRNEYFLNINNN